MECSDCWRLFDGGLAEKVFFRTGWNLICCEYLVKSKDRGTQGDLCVLIRLNPGVRRVHLVSQFSWRAAHLLDICVYPVYLVDKLILICSVPLPLSYSGASGGFFDFFQGQNYVVLLPGWNVSRVSLQKFDIGYLIF